MSNEMSTKPLTSEHLTLDELANLKRLCENATPGPWHTHLDQFGDPVPCVEQDVHYLLPKIEADAYFIAAARNLLPRILAELEELRGQENPDGQDNHNGKDSTT